MKNTEKVSQFLQDFKEKAWQMPNIYERFYELMDDPCPAFCFCKNFIFEMDKSTTFFHSSLSFLTEEDLQKIVILAFENIEKISVEIIEDIVSYTALQYPYILHPYLSIIFERKINRSSYFSSYPWRDLPESEIEFFKSKLINSTDEDERYELILCLLQTEHLPTLYFLKEFVEKNNILNSDFIYYLWEVGFTLQEGEIVSYCPNNLYHFIFPKPYFLPKKNDELDIKKHPTWNLKFGDIRYKFGGELGNNPLNPMIHLLTLNPVPKGINIGIEKISFAVHIRELNDLWEPIFYKHDENGIPTRIGECNSPKSDIYSMPILPCEIALSPTPKRWQRQDWAASNSRENLFRLGGKPTWVQSGEPLKCPTCGEKMDFLFQIDSFLPDVEGNELYFGSGGILYAFWCDKSRISGYIFQCT